MGMATDGTGLEEDQDFIVKHNVFQISVGYPDGKIK